MPGSEARENKRSFLCASRRNPVKEPACSRQRDKDRQTEDARATVGARLPASTGGPRCSNGVVRRFRSTGGRASAPGFRVAT